VSTIDGEQVVEILDRGFLDAGRLRNAGVRYQHIEPVAYNFPDLFRDLVRAYRGCQIRPDRLGAPAPLTNLVDDAVGLSFTAAVQRLPELSRAWCRRVFEQRFDAREMARQYELVYQQLLLESEVPASHAIVPVEETLLHG